MSRVEPPYYSDLKLVLKLKYIEVRSVLEGWRNGSVLFVFLFVWSF